MSDAVTSQTLVDGTNRAFMKFTNVSDGTGEAAVLKVDVSTLAPPATAVNILRIWYVTQGMSVTISWDATTDVTAWIIAADDNGVLDFSSFGGLKNNSGAGKTGDIMFTTVGHTAADNYSIILEMSKGY